MKRNLSSLLLALTLVVNGCASPPDLISPEQTPPYLRKMKAFRLYGYEDKVHTDIPVNAGDLITVIASKEHFNSLLVGNIVILVGRSREVLFWTSSWVKSGLTFASPEKGHLSFQLTKSFGFKGGAGDFFEIWVFVWGANDYETIVEFLGGLQEKYPHLIGISDALEQANALKKVQAVKNVVSQDLAATQKRLDELRKEQDRKTAGSQAAEKSQRIKTLENRIALMSTKLSELEELSQKLLAQREKTAELAKKVEEWETREKEIFSRNLSKEGMPPSMLVISPQDGDLSETGNLRISGVAEDDESIKKIEVYVNRHPIQLQIEKDRKEGDSPLFRRQSFAGVATLKIGVNLIKVSVTDTDGLSVEKNLTVQFLPSRRNVWAVVVGINDYPRLPQLKYAVNDALAFQRLLIENNRVPEGNITVLINEQASLRNLRSALGTGLKSAAGSGDLAIIFFAGHGATERDSTSPDGDGLEKYILAYDSDPADLFSSALPMRDIALIFNRIQSERLIFIADACYSGASGGRTISVTGTRANITDGYLERISGGRGKVIITASAANEVSVEKDELRHGVFTYYLLEGLRGAADMDRDGTITVDEAYRYVSEKVPHATGQEQHPVKKGSVEGSLVLGIIR
jgi:hypothetical protein